ncbi:MAG: hypothetical protein GXX12_11230 [Methanosarcina thermophila]|nr:hypothetical protein [Methanosarcina thermophila]
MNWISEKTVNWISEKDAIRIKHELEMDEAILTVSPEYSEG